MTQCWFGCSYTTHEIAWSQSAGFCTSTNQSINQLTSPKGNVHLQFPIFQLLRLFPGGLGFFHPPNRPCLGPCKVDRMAGDCARNHGRMGGGEDRKNRKTMKNQRNILPQLIETVWGFGVYAGVPHPSPVDLVNTPPIEQYFNQPNWLVTSGCSSACLEGQDLWQWNIHHL